MKEIGNMAASVGTEVGFTGSGYIGNASQAQNSAIEGSASSDGSDL
jgi:hypothetical protein